MTNSQMLRRFRWNGGLIFKVFFLALHHSTPFQLGVQKGVMIRTFSYLLSMAFNVISGRKVLFFCRIKRLFLGGFFLQNPFSWPNGRLSPIACLTYLEASASAVNLGYLETISVHPTRRLTFAGKLQGTLRNF